VRPQLFALAYILAILASSCWPEAISQGGPLLRGQATVGHAFGLAEDQRDSRVSGGRQAYLENVG